MNGTNHHHRRQDRGRHVPQHAQRPSCRATCDPGPGRTLLTIGQDFFSIEEYVMSQYNASLHGIHNENDDDDDDNTTPMSSFFPSATMVYTDIQTLRGVDAPIDYGSGIEYFQGLSEVFPTSGLQIGLWLNGTTGCREIVQGDHLWDDNIHKLFANIAKWKLPKVFLRVGYEFDNPYFGYSEDPTMYVHAFKYMVEKCEIELGFDTCHDLVAFSWHSWAAPRWIPSLDDFYPGDDYVDWVGISIFQQVYPWATSSVHGDFAGGSIEYVHEILNFAKQHDKPVMIAESTPFGGMFWNGSSFGNDASPIAQLDASFTDIPLPKNIWDLWFRPTLQLIEDYDIRMWSYINCDWNSQPMWRNIGFGDTRLVASKWVMEEWWQQVLKNPRFVMAPLKCNRNPSVHSVENEDVSRTNNNGPWKQATKIITSESLVTTIMRLSCRWHTLDDELIDTFMSRFLVVTIVVIGMLVTMQNRYRRHSRGLSIMGSSSRRANNRNDSRDEATSTCQGYGAIESEQAQLIF